MMRGLLLVALGSALGGIARGLVSLLMRPVAEGWPWDIWLVNVAGSFAITAFAALSVLHGARWPAGDGMRLFVMVGFCGGFTTFSIFSLEAMMLWQAGATMQAGTYVGASLVGWLLGGVLGLWIGHWLNTAQGERPAAG
jgi:CrcB protein